MLGGAIDAIGLIDSRDTPPPSITEPPKKDRGLSVPSLSAPAEVTDPIEQPSTLPARGTSLPGGTLGYQHPSRSQTQPVQRQSSGHSVHSAYGANTTPGIPTARPWPAAMVYGNIKGLRNPGDRAKAYAKAINEIAKAESGLKEWCIASGEWSHSRLDVYAVLTSWQYRTRTARPLGRSKHPLSLVSVFAHLRTAPSFPNLHTRGACRPALNSQCEPTHIPLAKSRPG